MRAPLALGLALALLPGCLVPPTLPPRADVGLRDGGVDGALPLFEVLQIVVTDARGRPASSAATPRTPHVSVSFSSPPSTPELVLLLAGEADADLLDDLDATPLRTATTARRIATDATLDGATVTLIPREPLDPGALVTVAVPRWTSDAGGHRLEAADVETLTVSTALDAGARATDAWPPDGAFDVAPGLALAAVRFDGTLDDAVHSILLAESGGGIVPCTPSVLSCSAIGWPAGACVALVPLAPLSPSTAYELSTTLSARDTTGARLPAFAARFQTGTSTPAPPTWAPLACVRGEVSAPLGCLRADDESISFRGRLGSAARVAWTAADRSGAVVTPRGDVALRIADLTPSIATTLALGVTDYTGAVAAYALPTSTTEPLPTVSITEVRADPAGPEPRQEYVEIRNYGERAVSLEGMRLADDAEADGDALPATSLPAGAFALIVPDAFDPAETAGGADAIPPAGTLLVRVDASLGSGGLSNAGEPVLLRDALDRWISAAPATPAPGPGLCLVRTSASPRVGEPGSFGYDRDHPCTPGR